MVDMALPADVKRVLRATSRTFYIPISRLPAGLQEATTSAYLCMRAIDEIEDHPSLNGEHKSSLLDRISQIMQAHIGRDSPALEELEALFNVYSDALPEVTRRLGEWASLAPVAIAPRIWDATSVMADRMGHWVKSNWYIQTQADLDRYTFSVAGAVGLLICDLSAWFDGFQLNRIRAVQFGQGLQMVNILRNRKEDLKRGIDYLPMDWDLERLHHYARANLNQVDAYAQTLPHRPFTYFIRIPLVLALATLDALERGEPKLSRSAVLQLVRSA
jgi:farnesyl-diphosphate farnesyltransferase